MSAYRRQGCIITTGRAIQCSLVALYNTHVLLIYLDKTATKLYSGWMHIIQNLLPEKWSKKITGQIKSLTVSLCFESAGMKVY